ncbi:INS-18 protein [Aphelenchoides avenae]|nr:INS-18 protein [Aphelenchus avenae]
MAWQLTCGMRRKRSAEPVSNDFPVEKRMFSYYRPLSLTEMMRFCCQYGCSFRDLLPYCDPFGQWDS